MKRTSSVIWGLVLILAGVLFAINALGIANINIFFDGWWTLIIIIPCVIGFFTEYDKVGNLIGVLIGVFLLLCCQDILEFSMIWKLAIPVIIIIIGVKLITNGMFGGKSAHVVKQIKANGGSLKDGNAIFSGVNLDFDGEVFEGAELNAIFGGVKCDLTRAAFDKDCVINATAIFGGIDILVPNGINVKINSTSIFGGVSDKKRNSKDNTYTLYVNATCLFGGVDIK